MNDAHDKVWKELAKRVREGGRRVVSGEEAERMLRSLPDERISEAEVDAIVAAVLAGRVTRENRRAPLTEANRETAPNAQVEEDVLQLNRNKGGEDKDAEKLLEELRREALKDESNDEEEGGDGGEPRD